VTNAKLGTDVISGETDIGGAIADADLFLLDDGAGGTLRKTAASRIATYIGAGTNTPAFRAYQNSAQTVSSGADTLVNFQAEDFDTDSAYDTSTMRFTPQTAGKYYLHMNVEVTSANDGAFVVGYITKNGTLSSGSYSRQGSLGSINAQTSTILSANGSSDYFEAKLYTSTTEDLAASQRGTFFEGYKIIE